MKKIMLMAVIFICSCYQPISKMEQVKIPIQVLDFVEAQKLRPQFSDTCFDQAHQTENGGFVVCSSQAMGDVAWGYIHEVGHYVYSRSYCPAEIGSPCTFYLTPLNRASGQVDIYPIIREEKFAMDFADSNGELWLKRLPKDYTQNLLALSPIDYEAQLILWNYGIGNYPVDPLKPVRFGGH